MNQTQPFSHYDDRQTPIKTDTAEISIPIGEIMGNAGDVEMIKVASYLFNNMSGLLPEGLNTEYNNRLVLSYFK